MDSLDEQAAESIAFIRHTMARSASFTAVPGRGAVIMGAVGLLGAVLASRQPDRWVWLVTWLATAAVAVPIGLGAMALKARTHGVPLLSPSGRRFAQGLSPSLAAAAVLTLIVAREGRIDLLPAIWLLLYGAGIMAGATASVPILTWVGAAFIACGVAAGVMVPRFGDVWMGVGFGVLQIVFGMIIARKHGG